MRVAHLVLLLLLPLPASAQSSVPDIDLDGHHWLDGPGNGISSVVPRALGDVDGAVFGEFDGIMLGTLTGKPVWYFGSGTTFVALERGGTVATADWHSDGGVDLLVAQLSSYPNEVVFSVVDASTGVEVHAIGPYQEAYGFWLVPLDTRLGRGSAVVVVAYLRSVSEEEFVRSIDMHFSSGAIATVDHPSGKQSKNRDGTWTNEGRSARPHSPEATPLVGGAPAPVPTPTPRPSPTPIPLPGHEPVPGVCCQLGLVASYPGGAIVAEGVSLGAVLVVATGLTQGGTTAILLRDLEVAWHSPEDCIRPVQRASGDPFIVCLSQVPGQSIQNQAAGWGSWAEGLAHIYLENGTAEITTVGEALVWIGGLPATSGPPWVTLSGSCSVQWRSESLAVDWTITIETFLCPPSMEDLGGQALLVGPIILDGRNGAIVANLRESVRQEAIGRGDARDASFQWATKVQADGDSPWEILVDGTLLIGYDHEAPATRDAGKGAGPALWLLIAGGVVGLLLILTIVYRLGARSRIRR